MLESINIVLVDDYIHTRQSFEKYKNKYISNCNLTTFEEFDEGIITYNTDVLIIDYFLENEIAPNIIKKVKNKYPDLLIIAISGSFFIDTMKYKTVNKVNINNAIKAGANRALNKIPEEVFEAIDSYFKVKATINLKQ